MILGTSILVVDDDTEVRKTPSSILSEEGYSVEMRKSARPALSLLGYDRSDEKEKKGVWRVLSPFFNGPTPIPGFWSYARENFGEVTLQPGDMTDLQFILLGGSGSPWHSSSEIFRHFDCVRWLVRHIKLSITLSSLAPLRFHTRRFCV